MDESFVTEVLGINAANRTLRIAKRNGDTWEYKYKDFEMPEYIKGALLARQEDGWNPIALIRLGRTEKCLTKCELML